MTPPQRPPAFASPKELFAWCLYDFANSAFPTLIITVAYSVYFVRVVAQDLGEATAERLWFWGYAVSMLIAALLSPPLGALADARAMKRPLLIGSTAVCVACTALLAFVKRGDVALGLLLFGLANIAFELGFLFCSAFLVELTSPLTMGRLSGFGWGLGYAGGLVSLALAYPFLAGGFVEDNLQQYRLGFLVTALFFLVASLPTLFWLRERAVPQGEPKGMHIWRDAFGRLAQTAQALAQYPDLVKFLVSYLIYTDAINTVVIAAGIFAHKVLDFSPGDLIIYFLVTQVTAGLGAAGFGLLADRIGSSTTISLTLLIWIGVVGAAAVVQNHVQFYVIGLVAGTVLGANQATSRALMGRFVPMGKQGELFGFFTVAGKCAAVVGPMVYGEVSAWTGSQRWAVLAMAPFFVIGLIIMQQVDELRGLARAQGQPGPHGCQIGPEQADLHDL
jgi:UMF1 family MFS transporter